MAHRVWPAIVCFWLRIGMIRPGVLRTERPFVSPELQLFQGPGGLIEERLKTSARVNETISASQKNPARTTIRVSPWV